jgi:serine/threonine protein kinase
MGDHTQQQLGNYRLIRQLGRGGFADVYLGEHVYLGTQAAVKVLKTSLSNASDLERFLKEARIIAHLSHPNIVRVLDFGVTNETPFLVMDYAPNGTLRQLYPKGTQLPISTIIPYVKHSANALQYAHDKKLIHRDVKPENMLLGQNHELLLSDFGIALIAQNSDYQSTQDIVGTVAYMSPEQIQGKPQTASDQYSLGIVVYEWLCGDYPFHGSTTEVCTQHMFAPPPLLTEKVPGIDPAIEHVVMVALAKDPRQRFATIWEFALALEQAIQNGSPSPERFALVVPRPQPDPRLASDGTAIVLSQQLGTRKTAPSLQTAKGSGSRQPVAILTQYDWETVVRKVRLGDIPPNWELHMFSNKDEKKREFVITATIIVIFALTLLVAGISFLLFVMNHPYIELSIKNISIVIGIFCAAMGIIYGTVPPIQLTLRWLSAKNSFLVLLPTGLLEGDLRKAEPDSLIDFANTLDIQIRKKAVQVKQFQKTAPGTTKMQVVALSAFAEHKELAKSIEQTFLHFKQSRSVQH